jgi:hypothetical protein
MRDPRPYGQGLRFLFYSDLARMMLTLHRVLHHAHAQANMPKRQPPTPQTIFLFFGTSFPQNRGRDGVGARSSCSKNPQQQMQQRARETR